MQPRNITDLVLGLGEVGHPLFELLSDAYPKQVVGYDNKLRKKKPKLSPTYLHICIPYSKNFLKIVRQYIEEFSPAATIIHSTVPIGTSDELNAIHSPVLGRHSSMKEDMKKFVKWFGGSGTDFIVNHFNRAGFKTRAVPTSQETELLKLLCLAKYGAMLAFTQYQYELCRQHNVLFDHVLEWDRNYNSGTSEKYHRPLLLPLLGEKIGGHCVIPNTKILNKEHPNQMLAEVLKYE